MNELRRLAVFSLATILIAGAAAAAGPTYFGYTNGDMTKVGSYTNVVLLDAHATLPGGLYDTYLAQYNWLNYQVKTVLGFTNLLYKSDGTYDPQANANFDAWLARELPYFNTTSVLGMYPADEPLWRCSSLDPKKYKTVYDCLSPYLQFVAHMQSQLTRYGKDVPLTMLFGACDFNPPAASCPSFTGTKPLLNATCTYPNGQRAVCPSDFVSAGIDWVAHNRYGVKRPYDGTDADAVLMRADIDALKAMFPGKPWALVGDAFHQADLTNCIHHGWTAADHVTVADQDYKLACSKGAFMIMNFNWPSWSECGPSPTSSHGSNEFGPGGIFGSQDVLCYHRCIGRRIKYGETTCSQCGLGLYVNCP